MKNRYVQVGGSTSAGIVFVFLLFVIWLSVTKRLSAVKQIMKASSLTYTNIAPLPSSVSGSSKPSNGIYVPDPSQIVPAPAPGQLPGIIGEPDWSKDFPGGF
jgi:hypothetical protein